MVFDGGVQTPRQTGNFYSLDSSASLSVLTEELEIKKVKDNLNLYDIIINVKALNNILFKHTLEHLFPLRCAHGRSPSGRRGDSSTLGPALLL